MTKIKFIIREKLSKQALFNVKSNLDSIRRGKVEGIN